jgi:hypothetical protein
MAVLLVIGASPFVVTGVDSNGPPYLSASSARWLSVDPTTGPPGKLVTLQGGGWVPRTELYVSIWETDREAPYSRGLVANSPIVDEHGDFTLHVVIPARMVGPSPRGGLDTNLIPGDYRIDVGSQVEWDGVPFTIGPSSEAGFVWGQVFVDLNGDGIRDPTEPTPGLPAIHVRPQSGFGHVEDAPLDVRGWYVAPVLPPGCYELGYAPTNPDSITAPSMTAVCVNGGDIARVDIPLSLVADVDQSRNGRGQATNG